MATKRPEFTWENGYQEADQAQTAEADGEDQVEPESEGDYVPPPSVDLVTSPTHNHLGINVLRSWPTLYDGTNSPHGTPEWWQPRSEVDVLIVGAGPSGLGLAVSLLRQGVSFRIIDKADGPLAAGRADGVQPRFLETVSQWGLAAEIQEEGPIIERTAMYKDGEKLLFNRSHQSDSRYRGLHVITQGQIERIYIRDLLRHKTIVERSRTLAGFEIRGQDQEGSGFEAPEYPVRATVHNHQTGEEEIIQAKFLVGSDGGSSSVRKSLGIPFDGGTGCSRQNRMVMSSEHGCCAIIPREDGYIRLYTQLDVSQTGPISASRQARDPSFAESGGKVEVHSITPDEVLEQANKVFAPYKLKFGAPLSWFAIWKISERVARSYSSPDMRVHLAGDAAHVHSVLGAFGLNASILDVCNLGWKLGLASKGLADPKTLLPTYTSERRKHATRIIRVSGEYLRFISGSTLGVPDLDDVAALEAAHTNGTNGATTNGHANGNSTAHNRTKGDRAKDLEFIGRFFQQNGQFLLGVDCPYDESVVAPPRASDKNNTRLPIRVRNGVRAPNPRVCHATDRTGYLYDVFTGAGRFKLVVFASSLEGAEVRRQVARFGSALSDPKGFYRRYGREGLFQVVLVVKKLPFEFYEFAASEDGRGLLAPLLQLESTVVVYDDRAPDEDAHTTYGANHQKGAVAVVRPDLWVGTSCYPEETERLAGYFQGFLKV
ncbi:FAD binding domain-containing protein [Corynascus novoguineensis]|uniref:FAD binding domain-containing protein n=1 Tax=Corynascus novoguineensis TaxID=1126955 RepID=A0AAN7CMK9_9PEZI|nr:FAD binding domain-containing protein [Corynascus novoguineensis]